MLSIQELKSSTLKELQSELKKGREELVRIRIGVKTKHIKDLSLVSKQKKYLAQVLTSIKELELDEQVEKAAKL